MYIVINIFKHSFWNLIFITLLTLVKHLFLHWSSLVAIYADKDLVATLYPMFNTLGHERPGFLKYLRHSKRNESNMFIFFLHFQIPWVFPDFFKIFKFPDFSSQGIYFSKFTDFPCPWSPCYFIVKMGGGGWGWCDFFGGFWCDLIFS